MATTIEELRAVMRMELKPFMRDLQQMNGISAKAAKQVEQTWMQTNRRLDGIGKNMARSLIAPLTGVGAALGARELIRLTDTWTDLNGRVRIAAGGMREGANVMERLSDMARRTYSSLETTAESYLTNSQALKELGYSTNQQLDFTEALNNALVVSGAKGQRAEQVINALGKAMAFGELRGENLNTVVQTGGRVAQALADGLGVTTNELRKLGEAGKLKSSNVFAALTSQMQTLRDEADGMQATIGDAIQLLNNSFLEYVGGADQASGASARIAEAIIHVADNMDTVASAAMTAATAIIGALAGRAMIGATVQIVSTYKALGEFVRIARAAQGLGGLGPAFASLGANAGIIGLAVGGAAALALGHFANQAAEARVKTDQFNDMLDRMGISAKEAAGQIDEVTAAKHRMATAEGLAQHQEETDLAADKMREFADEMNGMIALLRTSANQGNTNAKSLVDQVDAYIASKGAASDFGDELDRLALLNPDWAGAIGQLKLLASSFRDAALAAGELAGEAAAAGLGNLSGPAKPRGALGASRRAVNARREIGSTYIAEQERRNALTREQRDLEDEILRIRKDMPEGALVTDSQLEAIAKANLLRKQADKKTGKKADPYGDATTSMQERIDSLVKETAVMASLNPLINDYGYAMEKARVQIELENAAKKAGLELDPARRQAIQDLAEGYAQATVEAAKLAEAQAATVEQMDNLRDAARDAMQTMIDGFLEGKDAGEIFANVLGDIGKQLISMGMGGLFGKGSGDYGAIGKMFGFADGGYTGAGGKHQPAGVVHKGEVVWSQRDVAKAGGVGVVESLRRGMGGYADGGVVAMPRLPSIPQAQAGGGTVVNFAPVIHAPGADAAGLEKVERKLDRLAAELVPTIKKTVARRSKDMW